VQFASRGSTARRRHDCPHQAWQHVGVGDVEEEMGRLRAAMDVVQADLDRSVVDAPRLQMLVIERDES
jgi:hypothetical protein